MKKEKVVVIEENRRAKRDKNICMSAYIIHAHPHNAKELSKKLNVSRATASDYITELLECGFIKQTEKRGLYKKSASGYIAGTCCRGKSFQETLENGKKYCTEKMIEVSEQLELWKGLMS